MFEVLVGTIVLNDNKVLMVQEVKEEAKGLLNIPAGHLEANETLVDAAKREVLEETGFNVEITELIDTQYFEGKNKNYVTFIFRGKIENRGADEHELKFDYYEIDYIRQNTHLLRKDKLILSALDKLNNGSADAIRILNNKPF